MSALDDMLRELGSAASEGQKAKAFADKLTEMAVMSRREYTLKRMRRAMEDGGKTLRIEARDFEGMIAYAKILLRELQTLGQRGDGAAAVLMLPVVMIAGDIEALCMLRDETEKKAA